MEFGKITGKTSGNKLQVKLRTGESLYAPMSVNGIGAPLPSTDWISQNKDAFLALVEYEDNQFTSPVIIGFYPVKGADSTKFNVTQRLLVATIDIVDKLLNGKVNTQIGPQPFMATTIQGLQQIKQELNEIKSLINEINL